VYFAGDYGTRRYPKEGAWAGGGKTETEADPPSTVPRTFTRCRIATEPTAPRINIWSLVYRGDHSGLFWLDLLDLSLVTSSGALATDHLPLFGSCAATIIFLQLFKFLSPNVCSSIAWSPPALQPRTVHCFLAMLLSFLISVRLSQKYFTRRYYWTCWTDLHITRFTVCCYNGAAVEMWLVCPSINALWSDII